MSTLETFPFLKAEGTIIDVRSPQEYLQGRVPGSQNLPLFDNEERAVVGTIYKQEGRDNAVEEGIKIAGPKLEELVVAAKKFPLPLKVYCARGGMRSYSIALLFQTAGLSTLMLEGGYKTFRRWSLSELEKERNFHVLGGLTGSGKTAMLHQLQSKGEQVLDLESLANHKGSAFGQIGEQPSNEQFENEIALLLSAFDPSRPIWVEDESRLIGTCLLPAPIFSAIQRAPLHLIERPLSERLAILKNDYAKIEPGKLIAAVGKIEKKLGGERARRVIQDIREGKLKNAVLEVLAYYDRSYRYSLSRRAGEVTTLTREGLSGKEWAEALLGKPQCRAAPRSTWTLAPPLS